MRRIRSFGLDEIWLPAHFGCKRYSAFLISKAYLYNSVANVLD
jgi:hypothetical protein